MDAYPVLKLDPILDFDYKHEVSNLPSNLLYVLQQAGLGEKHNAHNHNNKEKAANNLVQIHNTSYRSRQQSGLHPQQLCVDFILPEKS